MNISEIKKMSKVERLQVMEVLWDSLLNEEDLVTPEWHEEILSDRRKKITNNEAKFISLAELKASRKQ
jgi:hypothetical protein